MRAEVTAASRCAVTATLATLAGLGPYFTATTGDPGPGDWRPVRDLYDDAHALAGVAGHVGARIGSTEYRVAASTLFLGYAARLWSLTLGGIVRAGILPDADRLLWRDTDGRIDLHLAEPVGWGGTGLVDVAREMVLDRHLAPLVAAIRTVEPMPDRLLWGNAASALIGAARMLDGASDTAAMRVAETMLRDSRLIDTVDRQGDGYRRRSCCLFYRTPVSGYCGDCALIPPHAPEPGQGSDPAKIGH
ncbi:(2Fe-2S)-binding protein [Prescottella equi]|uniref:(2Fe-2S)-binding protein n=1 Tax=Rhodococcus hoagii TaxID=43767 RepID=UPI000A11F02D|nr:(2Fe-2S)-binding protein [Prescottella equi]NKS23818.1 hypothetical protein [Prescottella equi]ORJ97557.1 hypothetical protein A6F58_07375 [Prescottella equi]